MGEIKSALEKALERAASIKPDKEKLEESQYITEGKQLAAKILSGEEADIKKELKKYKGKQSNWVKKGFADTIIGNLKLPQEKEDLQQLSTLLKALKPIAAQADMIPAVEQQLTQFFTQYLKTVEQYRQAIKQQYSGRLREKEAQLSQQLGREVKISPEADPEYQAIIRQNLAPIEEQYQQHMQQIRKELKQLLGI
ncbi:DUF6657 family protein [Spirochaetia bacterium 38H-sp]|uniref:DUF6657 family protein n=1 Tax=Rarispira pelagica TaxID=3141764 RepID=A0ABU9U9V0_9SPIR